MSDEVKRKLVIGVSGASGAPLAQRLLQKLRTVNEVESHLVISRGGEMTVREECSISVDEFCSLADVCYDNQNIGAAIASGTFDVMGMVVLPCSMKTLSGIVHGYSDSLLLRAADVNIKEQRRLVLVPRETPMSVIHLDNLAYAAKLPGVMVLPPVISYYHHPTSLEDMEEQMVGKILHAFGVQSEGFKPWS